MNGLETTNEQNTACEIADYLAMLKLQQIDAEALVVDGVSYTYGELVAKTEAFQNQLLSGTVTAPLLQSIDSEKYLLIIRKADILSQLIPFLGCMGTNYVPLIIPYDREEETFLNREISIPDGAIMAVCTSGTTGEPKILFRNFHSWYEFFSIQNDIFQIDETTRMFAQGSLAFTGNLNFYMGVFFAGGTMVVRTDFYPKTWEAIFMEYKVNVIYLIPSKLLLLPRIMKQKNHEVQMILSGSQSLGTKDYEQLKTCFPKTRCILYYGASELNYITYVDNEHMNLARNLIGKAFPNVSVFVKEDKTYVDTPYHIEGIQVPFSLNDTGYFDQEGNLYFSGRKDEILNCRGRKVSALKIENALEHLEGVNEAAVVLEDYKNDSHIVAYVTLLENEKNQEQLQGKLNALRGQLKQVLLSHEIPKQIHVVDSFIKTESGKIDKKQLCRNVEVKK